MAAPLETLLKYLNSGYVNQAADDSIINSFGGADALLDAARKYDQNAQWRDVQTGESNTGRTLDVDIEKLPTSKAGKAGFDLRPATWRADQLLDKRKVVDDEVYGSVTDSGNFAPDREALWTKVAPLVVSMLAPMAGAALAGAGIGGAAGLTSAVTGSGLGSVAATELPKWGAQLLQKTPNFARTLGESEGKNWMGVLQNAAGTIGNTFGIPSSVTNAGLTLGNLARLRAKG